MKRLVTLLMLVMTMIISSISVFAERSEVDSSISMQPSGEINSVCRQANSTCGIDILVYSNDGVVSFSNSLYSELEMEEKREFMEVALGATRATGLGTQQKNKLYNFIAEQDSTTSAAIKYLKSDTSADFVEAKAWFRPFSGPISTIVGVICILVFMFIAFSMLFDCAYLSLPAFQGLLERGNPNKRPFGVSREAWSTMKEIYKPEMQSRNIMSLYFSKRIPVIIICSIALAYIISGQIYDLMVFFVDAFNNMF